MAYQPDDVEAVWDSVAESYSQSAVLEPDYQAVIHTILRHVGDPTGKTICEVGCGSGMISAVLGRMGAKITLVDKSPKALDFARGHLRQQGLKAEYYLQDATGMDFADEKFDVVWNGGVIEHFTDEGKVALIREMWRIVSPEGILLILAPNRWDIPFSLAQRLAKRRGTWQFGYEDDLSYLRLRRLASRSGLSGFALFAFNPIVGWWFLPHGRSLMEKLGLNTTVWHRRRWPLGNVLCLSARKAA